MRRKVRRRPVHYVTFAYRDGAIVGCIPARKPADRAIKAEGIQIDEDLVCKELFYGSGNFAAQEVDQRVRSSDLLANRLNMRRTVRELVLPELTQVRATLARLGAQLERIEMAFAATRGTPLGRP